MGTFVTALIVLILIPHRARRVARTIAPQAGERPDTQRILASNGRVTARAQAAEAALVRAHAANIRRRRPAPVTDTFPAVLRVRRDSLSAANIALTQLLERAESAPLFASYRALGELPQLRDDVRVKQLLDSLAEVERDRDAFGAVGGVDPIFVALTSRAGAIGKEIQDIATAKRGALRRQLGTLQPTSPPRAVQVAPPVDTVPLRAARDSAARILSRAQEELERGRRTHRELDIRARRAREVAAIAASPPAMLASALVLGLVVAFAVSLTLELRQPRIADVHEAERNGGLPVLARVRPFQLSPERARRKADQQVAPLIDQMTDTYRQLFLHLSDAASNLPLITVVGDDPAVVATVAANLGATAAHEARTALLIDADFGTHSVSAVLHLGIGNGLAEILEGEIEWPETVVPALVGRDRSIDVVRAGCGSGHTASASDIASALRAALAQFSRRYETVVLSAPWNRDAFLAASASVVGPMLLCVRVGRTTLSGVHRLRAMLLAAGGQLKGLVLWDVDDPVVPILFDQRPPRHSRESALGASTAAETEVRTDLAHDGGYSSAP